MHRELVLLWWVGDGSKVLVRNAEHQFQFQSPTRHKPNEFSKSKSTAQWYGSGTNGRDKIAMIVEHETKPLWVVARLSRDVVHKSILDRGFLRPTQIPNYDMQNMFFNLTKFWNKSSISFANVKLVTLHRVLHLNQSNLNGHRHHICF